MSFENCPESITFLLCLTGCMITSGNVDANRATMPNGLYGSLIDYFGF